MGAEGNVVCCCKEIISSVYYAKKVDIRLRTQTPNSPRRLPLPKLQLHSSRPHCTRQELNQSEEPAKG
jgi:hypothetical protein